jgi:hypothetical protein
MEIAIIALIVVGLVFTGIALRQARPSVTAERVPGHPDTFELCNQGPGTAVIVHAEVITPTAPQGTPIDNARGSIPGLTVDQRIQRDDTPWARGSTLEPLKRFEVRLPSATSLRIVYRGEGLLGSMATTTMVVEGSH